MKTPKTANNRRKMSKKQLCNKSRKRLVLCNTHVKLKKKMSDRLDILKARCEQEIRDTEEKLRVLKAKLANLNSLAQESEKLANPEAEPDKYSNMGLTEAVLDAVKALRGLRAVGASPVEIKNYLLAHGFRAADNFDTAIYTVLGRLLVGGQIVAMVQRSGRSLAVRGPAGNVVARFAPKKYYKPK